MPSSSSRASTALRAGHAGSSSSRPDSSTSPSVPPCWSAQPAAATCARRRRCSTLEPALERFDFYTACAAGRPSTSLASWSAIRPRRAAGAGPSTVSRSSMRASLVSLRSDAPRGEGILRVVRLLLDHGADVNAHVTVIEEGETWNQGPLYGAAGIANNPELTRMLLAAGADVNELQRSPAPRSRLCHMAPRRSTTPRSSPTSPACACSWRRARRPIPKRISYCLARMLDFENPDGVESLSPARRRSELPRSLDARSHPPASGRRARPQPEHRSPARGGGRRSKRRPTIWA